MNVFIFTGNLTKDCRIGMTPNGKTVCNFTVANTTGKGGDYEHTEFIDCAIFGKLAASSLVDYLVKGKKVTINGEVKVHKREHQGQYYANLSVLVNDIDLGGKSSNADSSSHSDSQQSSSGKKSSTQAAPNNGLEWSDDIPF